MPNLSEITWQKSSFSDAGGNCVEVAALSDGRIALRDSKNPAGGVLLFTPAEMDAWIKGCKAGEFDNI